MNENKWCGARPEKCLQRQITVVKIKNSSCRSATLAFILLRDNGRKK